MRRLITGRGLRLLLAAGICLGTLASVGAAGGADGALPQPAEALMEPDLMETVCLNLLDNARKAMEDGGDILLEGLCEENCPVIRVTDSGKGIPEEELDRVTEAFYMVDKSRARRQGGAGLGLALCRRIVDLHGGALELESRPGQGTRVTVRLKGADL